MVCLLRVRIQLREILSRTPALEAWVESTALGAVSRPCGRAFHGLLHAECGGAGCRHLTVVLLVVEDLTVYVVWVSGGEESRSC